MRWWRALIDRWRRGPRLRFLEAELLAAGARASESAKEHDELTHHLRVAEERGRLMSEFLQQSGTVKVRCVDCGDLTFKWELKLDNVRRVLFGLCPVCIRTRARAAAAAEPKAAEEQQAEPAAVTSGT